MSYEELAAASQAAFQAGDFVTADMYRRAAQDGAGGTVRIVQMGDGALQQVPVEG
jgi:hypothetical protein